MEQVTLGYQIAKYRKEKGWTQEALANRLGVTNQAVSKWEADTCCPEVQLLPKLAEVFEISLDQLFGREVPVKPMVDGLPWKNDGTLRAVLYVGTRLQKHQILDRHGKDKARVEFHYSGPALNIASDFSVTCTDCTIAGNVDAGNSVTCGSVEGNVSAGNGVRCGDVGGSITAGNSVHCNMVKGPIVAGGGVRYHGKNE